MNLTGTQEKRTQVLKHHKDTLFQLQTGWESWLSVWCVPTKTTEKLFYEQNRGTLSQQKST